ncbi:MAG: PAS domain S-box protein [Alphaproteobacteria bacterium]|jgi:PAS domain S-box-containing protein|nr:PAS domain S-box protein [Alphaproteobacteria bacterium]MBT4018747.1 PAS domain S-box protein [Alphaproteobacteria bacterium]MBT6385287.1 PAS domain S-box protein [Alphaproteobacteria bacterium]
MTDNRDDPSAIERDRLIDFARAVDGWLWEMDENFRFTYISGNVEELTGLPALWYHGKTREELGAPDVSNEEWLEHLAMMQRHEPFRKFVYRRRGSGDAVWLRSDGFPLFDRDRNFTGYRGVGRLVTREVEAQRDATRSQHLLSVAIDHMDESFSLWDDEDKLIVSNKKFSDVNSGVAEHCKPGVKSEDYYRAMVLAGLVPPAVGREEEWLRNRLYHHLNPGPPMEIERQDGRWFRVNEHKIPDVGTASIATDITEKKNSEIAVLKNEQRFRDIADVSTDWYWETDAQNRYAFFSETMEERTGVPSSSVLGKKRTEIMSRQFEDSPEWKSHLEDLKEHRPFKNLEYPYLKPDGSFGWTRVNGKPVFDVDGNFAGYRGAATEISELHRIAEEMIAARERAEAANKAKTDFLSSISHELRTPMNSILGFSQLMADDPEQPLSEDQADSLKQIITSGQHLLQLINELLDLAQIESGKMTIHSETISFLDLLDSCLGGISTLAESYEISIQTETTEEILLRADEARLRQILLNLLSNAIKYNRPSGKVTIKTVLRGTICRIYVTDTGAGLAEEDATKVFEPFNRLGWENSETEGTGIGLAISKRLIEAMHGNIGYTSETGEGTSFWIDVPLDRHRIIRRTPKNSNANSNIVERQEVSRGFPSTKTFKLLYVEDNKANVTLMQQVIKRQKNAQLYIAETAEAGLIQVAEIQPDIIVMDINLPGMDGFEALDALKSNSDTRDIPVIALSADAMPHQVAKGQQLGFTSYLTKPLDIPEFEKILKELLTD